MCGGPKPLAPSAWPPLAPGSSGQEELGLPLSALSSASSSKALRHRERRVDLRGAAVRPPRLPRHRRLQETARLHFTTLPLAAVCGTLSYVLSVSLCRLACDSDHERAAVIKLSSRCLT